LAFAGDHSIAVGTELPNFFKTLPVRGSNILEIGWRLWL